MDPVHLDARRIAAIGLTAVLALACVMIGILVRRREQTENEVVK